MMAVEDIVGLAQRNRVHHGCFVDDPSDWRHASNDDVRMVR